MDLPGFLIEVYKGNIALVGAAAWPTVVAWIAWLFRKEIRVKLESLKSWDGLGVKLNFPEAVANVAGTAKYTAEPSEQAEKEAEALIDPETAPNNQGERNLSDFGAGRRIVSSAFGELAAELRRVAGPSGYTSSGKKRYVSSMLRTLLKSKKIPLDLAQQIADLRRLRNIAAHSIEDIDGENVIEYLELIEGAKQELKRISPLE